jgi:lipopolysaccharide heptosyltransferase II
LTSLVIQTAFLGDVLLTTPLLSALAERHGPLDVVTTPGAVPLLETHPAVRQVLPFDKRTADRGPAGLRRLARRLRAERYETAYLPHRSLRSALLARLAGVPRRVGYRSGWRMLYTETRLRPAVGHEIDRLLALADVTPRHQTMPSLQLTAADVAAAEALLRAEEIAAPFVALAPGSIWGSKCWSHYPTLARRLVERVPVVLVGGPDDTAVGAAIVREASGGRPGGKLANAAGRLTLRQSAALIERARVLVTNDSAPLHLAQAVGTPTVAIFGPTVPTFGFGPRGPRDVVVGLEDLVCRPCSAHGPRACPLHHHLCMQALPVEDVLHAIEETGALHRRH